MGSSLNKGPALRPYKKDHTRDPSLEKYPQEGLQRVSTLVFDHPKPTRNPNPKPLARRYLQGLESRVWDLGV